MLAQSPTLSPAPPSDARLPPHAFAAEILAAADAASYADFWADLAGRSLEPNIFFEPEFALPALEHLGAGRKLRVVFVWNCATTPRRLVGALLLALPRAPLAGCCRAWVHNQAVLGTPLLDRECAEEAFEAMRAAIARAYPHLALLLLPQIPTAGPTFALMQRTCRRNGEQFGLLGAHERAVLRRPFADPLSSGAAAELRRLRRRLGEAGPLAFRRRQDPSGLAKGIEQFLILEAGGWKGRRKTALAGSPSTAAFARGMAERLGKARKLFVDSLELGGRPVAMGLILKSGNHAYFWKTAYDEAYAVRSPGVLLAQDLTTRQIADPSIVLTDSCARPDHAMINRLWPGRIALVDVAVPLHRSRAYVGAALLAERLRRAVRSGIKFALARARAKPRR